MTMDNPSPAALWQNLIDAGCDEGTAQRCFELWKAQENAPMLRLLNGHRVRLLKELHACQDKIDCLDYLIFQLTK